MHSGQRRTWGIIPRPEVREARQASRTSDGSSGLWREGLIFCASWRDRPKTSIWSLQPPIQGPCHQPSNTEFDLVAEEPLPPFLGLCRVLLRRLDCGSGLVMILSAELPQKGLARERAGPREVMWFQLLCLRTLALPKESLGHDGVGTKGNTQ